MSRRKRWSITLHNSLACVCLKIDVDETLIWIGDIICFILSLMLKVICHKWKLKQMCERQGRHMTNHRPLQGSLFRILPNAARYYVLCFAKQLAAITPSCKMTKRWLIRNLSICGLNQQSMALQVSWHQNLWNENLAQNTFLHTSIFFWHMLRAKREISSLEQAGFCNHWLQYFMSCECEECKNHQEAKKGAHRTRYIEWTNKREVNENVYGAAYICILRFLRLITTPLFQQDSHCKSFRQYIVEPLKLTLLTEIIPLCDTLNPNSFR